MSEKTEQWAIVELFGHQTIAGRISEQTIGGCSFIRIDVPEVDTNAPYTKLFGNGAIYAITPCDEETARGAVRYHSIKPMDVFSARQMLGLGPVGQADLYGEEGEEVDE